MRAGRRAGPGLEVLGEDAHQLPLVQAHRELGRSTRRTPQEQHPAEGCAVHVRVRDHGPASLRELGDQREQEAAQTGAQGAGRWRGPTSPSAPQD